MTAPLHDFLCLSRHLAGVDALDEELAAELMDRVIQEPAGIGLPRLLAEFRAIESVGGDVSAGIANRIMGSTELAPLAQQITLLWYTSGFEAGGQWRFGTPRQYFGALMWPIIGAHPPALSGGYFGYWKYPPET
ncbi:MAG: hypothetical protein ACKVXR_04885 [Planctomycetota bacterium]